MTDRPRIERCEALITALTKEAERRAKKEAFTRLEMMGLISTFAVRWAADHDIPPAEYARISNELLDAMTNPESQE